MYSCGNARELCTRSLLFDRLDDLFVVASLLHFEIFNAISHLKISSGAL